MNKVVTTSILALAAVTANAQKQPRCSEEVVGGKTYQHCYDSSRAYGYWIYKGLTQKAPKPHAPSTFDVPKSPAITDAMPHDFKMPEGFKLEEIHLSGAEDKGILELLGLLLLSPFILIAKICDAFFGKKGKK